MPDSNAVKLTVLIDTNVVQTVSMTEAVLTIGRTPDNGLVLDDRQVSRRHAELRRDGDALLLVDVGSTNGTFVEGERLPPDSPFRLSANLPVRIGTFTLVLQPAEAPQEAEEIGEVDEAAEPPVTPPPTVAPSLPRPSEEPIPTFPAPLPLGPRSQYLEMLPAPFQEADFLGRFLLLFESVWEPIERRQDHIPLYFDPRTCPATFLPFLAQWLGIELAPHWTEKRRRRLLYEATELYRWRGTLYGLSRFVELCIGVPPSITEVEEEPFTLQIVLPPPPGGGAFPREDREAVRRIIETHKPAHIGYYLMWND